MKTITFYSYKGGTGRSLAVANTARFLARFGCRVFVLDFDLEAPGLHYKLGLCRCGEEGTITGLVDFIQSFKATGNIPALGPYVQPVKNLPSEFKGSIFLLPAGNAPSSRYSRQLAEIQLQELFNPQEGANSKIPLAVPLFLELKARIEAEYEPHYLLIDSRTGVTEIGGIALRVLPDTVVCLVHTNDESRAGARRVLRNVRNAPRKEGDKPIEIVLAVTRTPEMSQKDEEALLQDDIKEYFNRATGGSEKALALKKVLALHTDPNLQVVETLLIGSGTTANESVLIRDYFKLFLELRLDERLEPEEKAVINKLAYADQNDSIRRLLVGGRRLEGESTLKQIRMLERLQGRSHLKVVYPAYILGDTYEKFVNRVIERLGRRVSSEMDDPIPIPQEVVRWELLAVHLREGVLDFCADLYWLTENRSYLVEIVQLGWCSTFKAYLQTGSEIHKILRDRRDKRDFSERMLDLFSKFDGLAICVLGDTPAASETNRLLSSHLKPTQLISKGNEEDLLDWLESASGLQDLRLAICDDVVVKRLNGLNQKRSPHKRKRYSSDVKFAFAQPIPVGIVYPREDRVWRKEISKAIAYSLVDLLKIKQWDRTPELSDSIAENFAAGGIDALSLTDLRASLLLDLSLEEAILWNTEMDVATSEATQSQSPKRQE